MERKVLSVLEEYGYVYTDDEGYYNPYYIDIDGDNGTELKPAVIVQSFVPESIHRFNAYSDGNIPRMFLLDRRDIDETDGIEESVMQWVLDFADIVGCWHGKVE